MWTKDEPRNTTRQTEPRPVVPPGTEPAPLAGRESAGVAARLGSSVFVKGELTGSEDLTVDGQVEGRITLPDHALIIGPNAKIRADIAAKVVTVFGTVVGNVKARGKVDIRAGGSLTGDLACAHIAIQEGAHLSGKVDMPLKEAPALQAVAS